MGHTEAPPRVRPSTLYPGCLYCENCNATYTPHLEWGYRWPMERNDTTGRISLYGIHRKGDECPICGRKPDAAV